MKIKLFLILILTIVVWLFLPNPAYADACDSSIPGRCCNIDIASGRNLCTQINGCEHLVLSDSITTFQDCLNQYNFRTQSYSCPSLASVPSFRSTCSTAYPNIIPVNDSQRPCCRTEGQREDRSTIISCYGTSGNVVETNSCLPTNDAKCSGMFSSHAGFNSGQVETGETFDAIITMMNWGGLNWTDDPGFYHLHSVEDDWRVHRIFLPGLLTLPY